MLLTHGDCLAISADGLKAVLLPNLDFTPKVVNHGFRAQTCVLQAFFPPSYLNKEETRLHGLCPVCVLAQYVLAQYVFAQYVSMTEHPSSLCVLWGEDCLLRGSLTGSVRLSASLLSPVEDLRHLIKGLIPRGVAAATALLCVVCVGDICGAVSWASPLLFVRYYLKDMSSSAFATSVHGMPDETSNA